MDCRPPIFLLLGMLAICCASKQEHRIKAVAVSYPLEKWQKDRMAAILSFTEGPPRYFLSPIGEDGWVDAEDVARKLPQKYQDRWFDPKLPASQMNIPQDVWSKAVDEVVLEQKDILWPDIKESRLFR